MRRYGKNIICFLIVILLLTACAPSGENSLSSAIRGETSASEIEFHLSSAVTVLPKECLQKQDFSVPYYQLCPITYVGRDGDFGYFNTAGEIGNKVGAYYYNGTQNEKIGQYSVEPMQVGSGDYVFMPDGRFYSVFGHNNQTEDFYLVEFNPNTKTIREIKINDDVIYDDVYNLFYYAPLGNDAFAMLLLHTDPQQKRYYYDVLKYEIASDTWSTLLRFTADRPELVTFSEEIPDPVTIEETHPEGTIVDEERLLYGIASDENSFYLLTALPKENKEKEYSIQQYSFNGVFQREFFVPELQKATSDKFIQSFHYTDHTFFIGKQNGAQLIYQIAPEVDLRVTVDGKSFSQEAIPLTRLASKYSLFLPNGQLLYHQDFPYVYMVDNGFPGYIFVYDVKETQIYRLNLLGEQLPQGATAYLHTNYYGDLLLCCSSDKDEYYFIHAEDIIANMQLFTI